MIASEMTRYKELLKKEPFKSTPEALLIKCAEQKRAAYSLAVADGLLLFCSKVLTPLASSL
jgi:hypothetical protein